uniref:Uncharacterized protein n=1 Tax=Catagonus wagneri TaxID=51154 RepID=A0A8C3YEX8_9CETA
MCSCFDPFRSRVRMSVRSPLRLQNLAAISLLRDEASAISALEYLPTELFPLLFMAAFYGRRRETLKAMVQVWPFARLPLGGLMRKPHKRTLQAVLGGLDVLLAQKDCPRRCKLRVLDLRNTDKHFWRMWAGARDRRYSGSPMAAAAEDMSRTMKPLVPLEVFIELCLKKRTLCKFLTQLLRWVGQKTGSVLLCCKKLKIVSMPKENIKKVLRKVQLDCIQEVEAYCTWNLSALAMYSPHLGTMSNVQRLLLSSVHAPNDLDLGKITDISPTCHLPLTFSDLIAYVFPRCLKNPLDKFSITHCLLTESDLADLSRCPIISHLKGLNLSGITLTNFNPALLQVLLEKVAATLEELDLNLCGIMDSQMEAILPALSHCFHLTTLSLCGNFLSKAVMERLLHHTDGLPVLDLELYPAPRESYSPNRVLQLERLAQLQVELLKILQDLGQISQTVCVLLKPCMSWMGHVFHLELIYLRLEKTCTFLV